jgi:hypothetical protein
MKVAIILSSRIDNNNTPYLKYFTKVFENNHINFEYICWDRNNTNDESLNQFNVNCFKLYSPESNNLIKKLFHYWLFSRYVIKILEKSNFDLLTVHTIVNTIFLKKYLLKHYKKKYIFDIRDYSPIVPFCQNSIKNLILHSAFTSISSEGFKKWLPKNSKCIIGHNIEREFVIKALKKQENKKYDFHSIIKILAIGHLRNYETNIRLINDLGNKENISMVFAGGGVQKLRLENFSKLKFSNVIFLGQYLKTIEPTIVQSVDFLNIILPNTVLESTLMSNRFYLSLVHRKPMIVNEESEQTKLVLKYKLGFVVNAEDNIYEKLLNYIENFNSSEFEKGCLELLQLIEIDINNFENKIRQLCV